MRLRRILAVIVLTLLGAAALSMPVSTDPGVLFSGLEAGEGPLDTESSGRMVLAVEAADPAGRRAAGDAVLARLRAAPEVVEISAGPAPPSRAALDFVWAHRFHLAPPRAEDLTPAAMTETLTHAREALTAAAGLALADRLLADPTGSFERALARLSSTAETMKTENGRWRARDASAHLILAEAGPAAPLPSLATLAAELRETARANGAVLHLVGPRIVAAEVSARIERSSIAVATIAAALLLGVLALVLRHPGCVALALLPLSLGIGVATVVVGLIFGAVHVVALGFGGALTGLALDYPLHLMAGGRERGTGRLVLIGAGTTAIGFLAAAGSGIGALEQVGVFVATGLLASAIAALLLVGPLPVAPRGPVLPALRLPGRIRLAICGGIALTAGLALLLSAPPTPAKDRLFAMPAETETALTALRRMTDLPVERIALTIEAPDAPTLIARGQALRHLLKVAAAKGAISGHAMLADLFPAPGDQPLPEAGDFADAARQALSAAGLAPTFLDRQTAEYEAARATPLPTPAEIAALPGLGAVAGRVTTTEDGLREQVSLYGLTDQAGLAAMLTTAALPGVTFEDRQARIAALLSEMRARTLLWLAAGAAAATLMLAGLLRDVRAALAIAGATGAGLALTALVSLLAFGPLGVFQIVALTLVAGIGIDYGLFLRKGGAAARRSVALCALSSLTAFATMAFAPVALLAEIGLTVSLGTCAMLGVHLVAQGSTGNGRANGISGRP